MNNLYKRVRGFLLAAGLLIITILCFQNCGDMVRFSTSEGSIFEETPVGSMVVDADRLEMTPSGCTDSNTPVCDGGADFVIKRWGTSGLKLNANSDNGAVNTNIMRAKDPNSDAAAYCANMVYSGYDDWYLPSRKELEAMFERRSDFGNIGKEFYNSSTETTSDYSYIQTLVPFYPDGSPMTSEDFYKETKVLVRCIRKI